MLNLDPWTTAVVVVDMQNDFCHPGGYYAKVGRDVFDARRHNRARGSVNCAGAGRRHLHLLYASRL